MYIIVQHLRSPQQIIRLHFTFTLASPSVTPTLCMPSSLHALLSAVFVISFCSPLLTPPHSYLCFSLAAPDHAGPISSSFVFAQQ